MKINFNVTLYNLLLEDAKGKETSLPKLITQILTKHYNDSHKGVQNERQLGNRVSLNTERDINN